MDFRKELNDVATAFELQEQALADARARIAFLEAQPGAPAPVETLPPLPVFDSYEDFAAVGWKRWPDSDLLKATYNDAWMRHGLIGAPWPPIQNVVIAQLGAFTNVELRPIIVTQMLDGDAICNRRCVDVLAPKNAMAAIVQPGDGSYETDVADIETLIRNYKGGLRQPLSSWATQWKPYAELLAEVRPDLATGIETTFRFKLTRAG